ncbi:unnamed protein product [Periconia digitata]|uniref:Uncharacterized protein n=1 Tax=Periconia digitata TaxID=1303443 RepID=A0A9W4UBU7_9PLEO|nr:unnamed protein product [Periconia digitata]
MTRRATTLFPVKDQTFTPDSSSDDYVYPPPDPIQIPWVNDLDTMYVRLTLFLSIPIFARIFLFGPALDTFIRLYVLATTGVSMVHFGRGHVNLDTVKEVLYGLAVSSYPSWGSSLLQYLWVGSEVRGLRWEIVYWMFVLRWLAYFLPQEYGIDVESLMNIYHTTNRQLDAYVIIIAGSIVCSVLWPAESPLYEGLIMLYVVHMFVKHYYLAYSNYSRLCEREKKAQKTFSKKNTYRKKRRTSKTRGEQVRVKRTFGTKGSYLLKGKGTSWENEKWD